ncbi:formylglycine-generating enzyme family protein [Citricoccus sp. NPDC055426]|uniref:formylglycine-generating enzyme family protein n=1 Tax=Citricoccus sp. NPDC055426 TaxID=3155536 RepID=UPI003416AD57
MPDGGPGTSRGPVTSGASDGLTELVTVPGGSFRMGSDHDYPEEAPAHLRPVPAFRLERHPVTTAQFARFVQATGYVTEAEEAPDPAGFPGVDPDLLVPGGLVFTPTTGPVPLDDWRQWWSFIPSACWRRPTGPGSTVEGLDEHPVVHVSSRDANAYARWAGRRLPTEAELEYAMGRDHPGAQYAWGDQERPGGRLMANTWQGAFPYRNDGAAGWTGTSPVGTFPADSLGLVDLTGNVWEWTSTPFAPHGRPDAAGPGGQREAAEASVSCCGGDARTVPEDAPAVSAPGAPPQYVVKGGSHLCAPEYCHRYRPSARQAQAADTASVHVGFRCAQ